MVTHIDDYRSMNAVGLFNLQPEKELYEVLKHSTPEERASMCKQGKFKAMCALIRFDEKIQRDPGTMPVHTSDNLFRIVLGSFPDFTQGLALIEATHPGFIYTDLFKAYTKDFLKIKNSKNKTKYTLGKYKYVVIKDGERLLEEKWYKDGELHRDGGPAYISYGLYTTLRWYKNGVLHRDDGPASVLFRKNNIKYKELWYENGEMHRVGGPAYSVWHENDNIEIEQWYNHGQFHRIGGPQSIFYDENGSIIEESWRINDMFYREDGPAYILWDDYNRGIARERKWYKDGKIVKHVYGP